MKTSSKKLQPRIINYRNYKYFENDKVRERLLSELCNININFSNDIFSDFIDDCKQILYTWSPNDKTDTFNNLLLSSINDNTSLKSVKLLRLTTQDNLHISALQKTKTPATVWSTQEPKRRSKIDSRNIRNQLRKKSRKLNHCSARTHYHQIPLKKSENHLTIA